MRASAIVWLALYPVRTRFETRNRGVTGLKLQESAVTFRIADSARQSTSGSRPRKEHR
jgi:hypothetical protein